MARRGNGRFSRHTGPLASFQDSYVRLVSQFILETSIADEVAEFTRGLGEVTRFTRWPCFVLLRLPCALCRPLHFARSLTSFLPVPGKPYKSSFDFCICPQVIPRNLLALFTADEFSLLMNGVCSIDVEDWKSNTQVTTKTRTGLGRGRRRRRQ